MKFHITKDELQSIANYLVERPWKEVQGLINLISNLKAVAEPASNQPASAGPTLTAVPAPTAAAPANASTAAAPAAAQS